MTDSGNVDTLKIEEPHDDAASLAERQRRIEQEQDRAFEERLKFAEERKAKQEQHEVEEEQNHRVLAPHIAGLRRGEASKKIDLKGLHEDRCRRNPSLVKKDPSPFQKVGAGLKKFCEDHGDKIATVVVGAIGLGLALGGSSGNTDISDNSRTRFINRHWATDTQRVYDSGEVVKNAAGRWIEKATGRFVKPMV